jgi:hypothetical protein
MTDKPTIAQQVDEVEGCYLSIRSAVEAYERAPQKERDRDTRLQGVVTGCARSKLEPLQAAIATLRMVEANQDWIREGLMARRADDAH